MSDAGYKMVLKGQEPKETQMGVVNKNDGFGGSGKNPNDNKSGFNNQQDSGKKQSSTGKSLATQQTMKSMHIKQILVFSVLQIGIFVLYGLGTTFGEDVDPSNTSTTTIQMYYPMWQDVHVMIFVGFGFLMTFTKFHSWTSVMFNFFVATWAIQWGILCVGFAHNLVENHWQKIELDIIYQVEGDFAAGAVLISFGAVLGKVNSFQLLTMATIEIVFYAQNVGLGQKDFKAVDMGGSMYVHTFGAYFGQATSYMLGPKKAASNESLGSNYTSNLFAAIGTIFLWMFWPSFNGVLASGNGQHRVVVNTTLALCACTMGTFLTSSAVNNGRFRMEDVLNATLAGGVIVGSSSDLVASPVVALVIGFLGGIISTLGFNFLGEILYEKFGIHDTCGVHNLHGIPGVLGGIVGAVASGVSSQQVYGDSLTDIFPELWYGRSNAMQMGFQFACLGSSLCISICSGLFTGWILRCSWFEPIPLDKCYDDEYMWVQEESEVPLDKKIDDI